jgi:hypothetical protein
MGFIMSAHFFPGNQIGSVMSGLLFLAMCFSSYMIPHEGYLHFGHNEDEV